MNEIGAIIGYVVGVLGLIGAIGDRIYNRTKDAKKDTKDCTVDTTTVIVKLENLQNTINRLLESITSIQTKVENMDHRLTVVETKLALGLADPQNLNI